MRRTARKDPRDGRAANGQTPERRDRKSAGRRRKKLKAAGCGKHRRSRQRRRHPRDYWGSLIFGTMNWLPGARITSHCASPLRAWPAWFTNSMLPTTL